MGPEAPIGPYVIERRLATGGMAEVYVAQRTGPHGFTKRLALKRILPQYAADPDFVAMFIDEAKLAAALDHPNIVQVFDFGEHEGELFLAMELVEGTNVNRLLRAAVSRKVEVPFDVAIHVAAQTARALAYAHRYRGPDGALVDFVHRDVSPANLLLTAHGDVKLTDFGIATAGAKARRTQDGHVRGKLGYMSPEQVMGRPLDGRSDVFTLGTVLAELLIGAPLFGKGKELDVLIRIRDANLANLDAAKRQIPRDIEKVLHRALMKRPQDRPPAAELGAALDEVARRRGFGHGALRLTRLLERLGLIEADHARPAELGGQLTSAVDTSLLGSRDDAGEARDATSPAIYTVRRPDGTIIGPMSFPKLVQLVTSGAISSDTSIQKGSGRFAIATELPELTRFVTSPALQWRIEELAQAERRGDLEQAGLLEPAFAILSERATGVLHLWDAERRKKIYFVDGRPEFVASTDRSELLGEYLVAHEYCLRMEVEMALALLPRYGGRLGDALVGLGVLRPVELFRAITDQVRGRLLEAFRWRRGHWAFVRGLRSHEETFPIGGDGFELLRDAVAEAHPAELEAALAPHWERVVRFRADAPVALDRFALAPTEAALLRELAGDATIGGVLVRVAGEPALDLEAAYRVLHLGLSCELLALVG
ncbi:MAG: serine/threonine-protein kinase [Myxococcota bacterium]